MRIVGALLILGLAASAPLAATPAGPAQDLMHEVRGGDDLHLIAAYYYGDARQWERIWQANRHLVTDPNRIEKGTLLRIPSATFPATPYAEYAARVRPAPPAAPPSPAIRVPPLAPEGSARAEAAPAATTEAPPTAPAKAAAPPPAKAAPAPPAKAPAPAKAAPAPAPGPPAAKAPAPAQPPRPLPPPPPPPQEWYEELLSVESLTSLPVLGGVGALLLGLVGLLIVRRRRQAAEEA